MKNVQTRTIKTTGCDNDVAVSKLEQFSSSRLEQLGHIAWLEGAWYENSEARV